MRVISVHVIYTFLFSIWFPFFQFILFSLTFTHYLGFGNKNYLVRIRKKLQELDSHGSYVITW